MAELLPTHPTPRTASERNETRVSRLWSLAQVHDRLFGRMGMGVGLRTHMMRRSEGASKMAINGSRWSAPLLSCLDHLTTSRPSRVPPVHRLAPASAPMESGRYALSGSPSPTSNGPAVGENGLAQERIEGHRVSDTLAYYEG